MPQLLLLLHRQALVVHAKHDGAALKGFFKLGHNLLFPGACESILNLYEVRDEPSKCCAGEGILDLQRKI